ncbi:MAG: hypothetical protein K1X88_17720 [Nannocystaceae bacterium]|nr:hypothetical protein [Nannocystaceae bacterium]
MTLARALVPLWLVCLACGASPPPAAGGDAKSSPPPAKAEAKTPEGKAGAANPHAGGMVSTAVKPKGPPREITPSGERRAEKAAELSFEVPKEWETQPVTSPMRVAQFVVPGPGGDAEMVVFRFAGGAGGIDANIARWKGQFVAPEGKTIDEITQTSKFEAGKLSVTLVDISGHYKAAERPGSTTMIDEDDYRMLAAIVEGAGDPFFFKLLGPGKTVTLWAKPFEDGLRAASAGA